MTTCLLAEEPSQCSSKVSSISLEGLKNYKDSIVSKTNDFTWTLFVGFEILGNRTYNSAYVGWVNIPCHQLYFALWTLKFKRLFEIYIKLLNIKSCSYCENFNINLRIIWNENHSLNHLIVKFLPCLPICACNTVC